MVAGKLLSAKLSARLSMGDVSMRQKLIDTVVQDLHRKRRRANLKRKRGNKPLIARVD